MIRTKLAKKILTKKEQKHLTSANIHSMAALKRQVKFMAEAEYQDCICFECQRIGRKLGIMEV